MLKVTRIACAFQHPVSLGMPNTSISGCKSITLFFCAGKKQLNMNQNEPEKIVWKCVSLQVRK